MHYPRPKPSMLEILPSLEKNWFCTVGHYVEWYSNSNILAKSKLNSKWL
jgi:hypothetical protein